MNNEGPESSESLLGKLRRERDELKLKLHLAGKEAQDRFDELEKKWEAIENRAEPLTGAVKEAGSAAGQQARKVTGAALDLAAKEIKGGYQKLRSLLDD